MNQLNKIPFIITVSLLIVLNNNIYSMKRSLELDYPPNKRRKVPNKLTKTELELFPELSDHFFSISHSIDEIGYIPRILVKQNKGAINTAQKIRNKKGSSQTYICQWKNCQKQFTVVKDFYEHVNNHYHYEIKKSIYKCLWKRCTYKTTGHSNFVVHRRKHTGEKPYKCPIDNCKFTTAQKGNLTKHLKIHTGEKTYKCTVDNCKYAAYWKCELMIHMKTHEKKT